MRQFEKLTLAHRSCRLHYWLRHGTGEKWVLFFHGAGLDHEMFAPQFAALDPSYNIIAWDARGHGLSDLEPGIRFRFEDTVSDCLELYKLHSIKKAAIVGQSIGGNLAQEIAAVHPELVERLVLIDCARNAQSLTRMEKLSLLAARPAFFFYPWKALIGKSAKKSSNLPEVQAYIARSLSRMDKSDFVDVLMEMTGGCIKSDPAFRFAMPVLILLGADDRLGNIAKSARLLAAEDPRCTLHVIKGASHNSNEDKPKEVNRLIAGFLK